MARIIIDVRSPSEYRTGHSSRAKNLPLTKLEAGIQKMADRQDEIWVCCESGSRSRQAVQKLKALGFRKIRDIGPWTNLR